MPMVPEEKTRGKEERMVVSLLPRKPSKCFEALLWCFIVVQ